MIKTATSVQYYSDPAIGDWIMTWKTTEEGYEQMAQDKEREAEALEWAEGLLPRQEWGEAFKDMAKHGDDKLPDWDSDLQSDFDDTEWEWE